MRNRHIPRICDTCQAPMACQEDACWRCGAPRTGDATSATRLRVIAGAGRQTSDDGDRWVDEGGSIAFEADDQPRVATNRR
jgi:hypothetical protein